MDCARTICSDETPSSYKMMQHWEVGRYFLEAPPRWRRAAHCPAALHLAASRVTAATNTGPGLREKARRSHAKRQAAARRIQGRSTRARPRRDKLLAARNPSGAIDR